jgi:O-antigen ligase
MRKFNLLELLSVTQLILYILATLFNPSGPQWGEKSQDVSDMTMSNPVNQIFYSLIFILAIASILPNYKKFFDWINREKLILFFLIWCGITVTFAIDPFISFKRYFQYVTTSLVFISFYSNVSDERSLLKILRYLFSVYVIVTLLVCILIPQARDTAFNTWRGLHATKNNLGQYASIAIIFFSYQYFNSSSRFEKLFSISFLLLSFILLLGSFSMTNIVLITIFMTIFLLSNTKKIFSPIGISYNFIFLLFVFFLFITGFIWLTNPELINIFFDITGKDPTLTGRTEIWSLVITQNINDLITGVGFQSFWIPEKLSKIILFQYWMPNQSHNGYIDMILEIGFIGLTIFIITIFHFLMYSQFKPNILWITIIFYTLILNFSESTLIRPHHFTNVMFYCSFWTISYKRLNSEGVLGEKHY